MLSARMMSGIERKIRTEPIIVTRDKEVILDMQI